MLFDQATLKPLLRAAKLREDVDLLIGAKVCVAVQTQAHLPKERDYILTTISGVYFSNRPYWGENQPIDSDQSQCEHLRVSLSCGRLNMSLIVEGVWLDLTHTWRADIFDHTIRPASAMRRTVRAELEMIG